MGKISRVGVVLVALVLAVGGLVVSPPAKEAAALAPPYNVIVLQTDDLDQKTLNAAVTNNLMPNLRNYFLESVRSTRFSNSFVSAALCCPSRATFLTGQYAHNHGVHRNWFGTVNPGGCRSFRDRQGDPTLAAWLNDPAGPNYFTGIVGKYLNGYGESPSDTGDCGYEQYQAYGWDRWHVLVGNAQRMYDYRINDEAGEGCAGCGINSYGGPSDPQNNQTIQLRRRVIDFLSDVPDGRNFFLYWAPQLPHLEVDIDPLCTDNRSPKTTVRGPNLGGDGVDLPTADPFNDDSSDKPLHVSSIDDPYLNPPTSSDFLCTQAIYRDRLDSLAHLDDQIGMMANELVTRNFHNNTVIFFASDNGFLQGDYRLHGKRLPYEESIRVPLAVRHACGASCDGPRNEGAVIVNTDLARTIVELANVSGCVGNPNDPCLDMDGQSFAGYLAGETPPGTWRLRFLIEHWTGDQIESGGMAPTYPTFTGVRTAPTDALATRNSVYVEHLPLGDWPAAQEYYDNLDQWLSGAPETTNDYAPGCCAALDAYLDRLVDCNATPDPVLMEDQCQDVENEVSA